MSEIDVKKLADQLVARAAEARALAHADSVDLDDFCRLCAGFADLLEMVSRLLVEHPARRRSLTSPGPENLDSCFRRENEGS